MVGKETLCSWIKVGLQAFLNAENFDSNGKHKWFDSQWNPIVYLDR